MPCLRHQIPALLFLMGLGFQLNAQDLESTNLTSLGRFWRAIESGTRPVTIIAFGDSLQADYRSVGTWLFPRMQGEWGRAGTACFDPWGPLVTKSANVVTTPFGTNWWHYHNLIGPEAHVYWHEPYGETASTFADEARLFYIATPQGGDFAISLSTNGGPWVSNHTEHAFSPGAEGRCVSLPLATNSYRIRVDGLTGTNIILGAQLFLSRASRVQAVYLQRDGMNLGQFFQTPAPVLAPIFSNLQPSLILWHMKELGDGGQDLVSLSNRLEGLEALWRTSTPEADVLYVGTPFTSADTNGNQTLEQNGLVRSLATRHGRAYVDGMSAMISYSYMTNNGYLADEIHPSNKYYQWLAGLIWDQALFSLARKDRTLQTGLIPEGWRLSCPSFTNAGQFLLSSTNLTDWSIMATNPPGSHPWQLTNPAGSYFRTQFFPPN